MNETTSVKIGNFEFDSKFRSLTITGGEARTLTTKESDLLKVLTDKVNTVVKRGDALNQVWGLNTYFAGRSMDVYISKLRKYLAADPSIKIQNHHGEGFSLLVITPGTPIKGDL